MFGPVLVIDESGFTKKGTHSVGVARQHNGRLGKVDPPTADQVGVFLTYATPAGSALLDHRLYLPKEWVNDPKRRKATRIPDEVTFRTKPEIKYYISNAGGYVPLEILARITGVRWRCPSACSVLSCPSPS